ncbi:MAG: rane protein [Alphaproteobacteria bacterium]|nr:rane protein [Alphaproteobacteria bacterium]
MNYFLLLGILIVVAGFALRLNPLLVVTVAALVTGLIAGLPLLAIVSAFGKAFNDNRFVTIIYILLPVIGLLERYGLQERARILIGRMKGVTTGRLLIFYLLFRQITASLGLTSVAGPAQTVRPLVAPMAEAAAERQNPQLDEAERERVKAFAAATDNVGLFFGEDIFIAIGSILLMVGFLAQNGIHLEPLHLSKWAIPSAILAFLIHGARLLMLDRRLRAMSGRMAISDGLDIAARQSAGRGAEP